MNFYILMNDYSQPSTLIFLHGIFDTIVTNPPAPSKHNFPYYLADKECPATIIINMTENQPIEFDYRHNQGYIVSEDFLFILQEAITPPFFIKKLSFYFSGEIKETSDKKYFLLYFPSNKFIDYKKSLFFNIESGSKIPRKISFIDEASHYDIFELDSSIRYGCRLVVNDKFKNKLENSGLHGFKIVPVDDALQHYCKDYRFDLNSAIKKERRKLP
ncbi:hypothetical protein NGUA41_02138 [Salmonella enterica]|nr:hypothetical protein NGUA40_04608 [Salmonella enterica]GAS77279.1 hypothetical protein NGUA41_02138 [Salmonella enterica]